MATPYQFLSIDNMEKKIFGEVFTNLELVEEMLDKLPIEVWSNPKLKFLDPANGIGNFPSILIKKLMEGLREWQPDSELRLEHILENQIYICELQSKNIDKYLSLFNPDNRYKLNVYKGSFLDDGFDFHMKNIWGLDNFNIVVGNPPYQNIPKSKIHKTSGSVIWDKFVNKSLNLIGIDGYLVFIHPSIWRKPFNDNSKIIDILTLFKKFNLIYLEIHNSKDGLKAFKAGTRYDFYCLQKNENYTETEICDEVGKNYNIDIRDLKFIPNKNIEDVFNLIGEEKNRISVIFNSSYHASRNYVSNKKDTIFKYPVIHSTPKNGPRILYSSCNNKGHFGIPKLIFGESGINDVIIDLQGEYGMTQGAIGLVLEDGDDPLLMKKVLESEIFKNIIESCMWSNFRIDAKMFMLFKKGWYYNLNFI